MDTLSPENLVYFLILIFPGFLSLKVYGLLQPTREISLKDSLLESICFGVTNFAFTFIPFSWLIQTDLINTNPYQAFFLILLIFFISPCLLAVILVVVLRVLSKTGWIHTLSYNSWDDFFLKKNRCWIVVHLKDGRRLGGKFGKSSYASLYPHSGHLYIEELWRLDDKGHFLDKIPQSKGIILRPDDYSFIELFDEDSNE